MYLADQSETPAINEDEDDVLSSLDNREESARLSCQIELTDAIAQLRLVMPAEF